MVLVRQHKLKRTNAMDARDNAIKLVSVLRAAYTDNILACYMQSLNSEVSHGKTWYADAKQAAQDMADIEYNMQQNQSQIGDNQVETNDDRINRQMLEAGFGS